MRKLLVLVSLFAALEAGAAERLLTPPAFAALRAYYSTPAIATDGTSYLAAWIAKPYARTSSLMLQRLDAPSALPVATVTDPRLAFGRVDLIWSNGSYLVVYNADNELHAMRAGRDGVPIAGSDRVLANDLRDAVLATNGTTTFLVAHTNFVEHQVVALTLDTLDRVVKRITIGNYAGARYDVAASDAGFVVALTDDPGLHALRFDAAGAQVGALIRVISPQLQRIPNPISVTVASRGAETLIAWTVQPLQQPYELSAVVLSASGDLGPQIALPHSGRFTGSLDAIGDGDGYTLLFPAALPDAPSSIVQLYALRLNADATPASEPRRVTTDPASFENNGRLARGSSGYGVVWIGSPDAMPPSTHDRVEGGAAPALTGITPHLLSRSATEQSGTSIASDGSGYLVAWLEQSSERDQIFAMPLDHNGDPSAPPLLLFDRAAPSYPSAPRVAFSGGTYAVVWIGDGAVQAMRVDSAGRPLDAQPLRLSSSLAGDFSFDVTPTPGGFFVVWTQGFSIYGAALTGPLPGAPQKLTEHLPPPQAGGSPQFESEPHIAFNGTKFLLAYTSTYVYPCGIPMCQTLVTWELVRLDASGRRETEPHPLGVAAVDVATDGRDFAVLGWSDLLRIDAQTLSVTARVPSERTSVLLWNGARYVAVAVDEEPDGGARAIAREITPEWTIAGARTADIAPRLGSLDAAVNAAGDVLAAYSRSIDDDPFQGASRAAVQFVRDIAPARRPAAKRP